MCYLIEFPSVIYAPASKMTSYFTSKMLLSLSGLTCVNYNIYQHQKYKSVKTKTAELAYICGGASWMWNIIEISNYKSTI